MRRLPLLPARPPSIASDAGLDAIAVHTPCEVPWDSMTGDNRVRFCGHCRQNVYNIEALAPAEAVRLIGAREGRLCVRFHRRRDGTVVTADCWARLRAARRKGVLAFAIMLVVVAAAQVFAITAGLRRLRFLAAGPVAVPIGLAQPAPPVMGYLVRPEAPTPPPVTRSSQRGTSAPLLTPPFILNRIERKRSGAILFAAQQPPDVGPVAHRDQQRHHDGQRHVRPVDAAVKGGDDGKRPDPQQRSQR